jgi:four helix bundle protein
MATTAASRLIGPYGSKSYEGVDMAAFKRFEEIVAWQRARELTTLAYQLTRQGSFTRDFGLRDQLTRASVSIMNNIAEGFGRHAPKQFAHFLDIANGSTYEVQSISYVALDAGHIDEEARLRLYDLADQTSALVSGLAKYLKREVKE